MSIQLYGDKASTTTRAVLLFCRERGLPLDFVTVPLMEGAHHKEPFVSLNPSRLVPVLKEDDFVLTESSAILKYLAERFDAPEYPKDVRERARVNERMDWLNTNFYREYGYHLIYPQLFPHHVRAPEEANRGTVRWGSEQTAQWLKVLDAHLLGARRYLCGDRITIADYFGASVIATGELIGVDLSRWANVSRWMAAMKALGSWKDVFDVHEGFAQSLRGKSFVTLPAP
jgi:glutathione S-transferase